jgi:hypothetical protein
MRDFLNLRRVIMIGVAAALVTWCVYSLRWDWLANPKYQSMIVRGLWQTIWMLVVTIPIGFVQAAGAALSGLACAGVLLGDPGHAAADANLAAVLRDRVVVSVDSVDPGLCVLADSAAGLALCGAVAVAVGGGV